ncbi:hypothetical protein WPS_08270 [Vulcanimicrobium alpinum]|uniref:HTH araC/xylS-type domain-containing protein n=1 Tax=Vulcanimicrobium alpinum TaxID=3016050 RepID=A0AAN1XU04_UNVUL|nr:AraC family transcriptional regulator [Vulcanimicrobium alpinum]BDE05551.1 hypothetical protein WPS_08270 [Vulcanimicrobium alpinum]
MKRGAVPTFLPYTLASHEPALEAQRFSRGHVTERFGLHGHRFHEIVVFDAPGGVHRVGAEEHPVSDGDIDVIAEGCVHDTSGFDGATGWMLLVRDDELDAVPVPAALRTFDFARSMRLHAHTAAAARICGAMAAIAMEGTQRSPGFATAMRAHLAIVLVELSRLAVSFERAATSTTSGLFERLMGAIDARLDAEIRLRDLADALALTPGYLTSEVRRISGRTAMEWVTARRLRVARRALLLGDAPIATVAAEAGFTDAGHLARRFRDEFGTTPARWRERMRAVGSAASDPPKP